MKLLLITSWSPFEQECWIPHLVSDLEIWNIYNLVSNRVSVFDMVFYTGVIDDQTVGVLAQLECKLLIGLYLDSGQVSMYKPAVFDHVVVDSNVTKYSDVVNLIRFYGSAYVHVLPNPLVKITSSSQPGVAVFLIPSSSKKLYDLCSKLKSVSKPIYLIRHYLDGTERDPLPDYKFIKEVIPCTIIQDKFLEIMDKVDTVISETYFGTLLGNLMNKTTYNLNTLVKYTTLSFDSDKLLRLQPRPRPVPINIDAFQQYAKEVAKDSDALTVTKKICYYGTNIIGSRYEWGFCQHLQSKPEELPQLVDYLAKLIEQDRYQENGLINLELYNKDDYKKLHRAGWSYVISGLQPYSSPHGLICDSYMDRTFIWGSDVLQETGKLPYTAPWVGFVHHSFDKEFSDNHADRILKNKMFQLSLSQCQGIICLSKYLTEQFRKALPDVPVFTMFHPSLFVDNLWNPHLFYQNKIRIVNVGAWYRNPFTIYLLEGVEKISLKGKEMHSNFPPENIIIDERMIQTERLSNKWLQYGIKYYRQKGINNPKEMELLMKRLLPSVTILETLSDTEYDTLMSGSVIFLDLVDASACNTIIECIVRNTPVIVNKISPVVEYLGESYPLYYTDISQISSLLTRKRIIETHQYMCEMRKDFLRLESFVQSFHDSSFYRRFKEIVQENYRK